MGSSSNLQKQYLMRNHIRLQIKPLRYLRIKINRKCVLSEIEKKNTNDRYKFQTQTSCSKLHINIGYEGLVV